MSISSRPMAPPSPACGLNPAIASRGCAMPKSARNASAVARACATIASVVSDRTASLSATWIVTGTTRRLIARQHHHHGAVTPSFRRQILGMSRILEPRIVERGFMNGIGDDCARAALPAQTRSPCRSNERPLLHWQRSNSPASVKIDRRRQIKPVTPKQMPALHRRLANTDQWHHQAEFRRQSRQSRSIIDHKKCGPDMSQTAATL